MTSQEKKLFSILVTKYINNEISHVCSDFNAVKEAGLTLEECNDLHRRMAVWSNSIEDMSHGPIFSDWGLTSFLKYLLESE